MADACMNDAHDIYKLLINNAVTEYTSVEALATWIGVAPQLIYNVLKRDRIVSLRRLAHLIDRRRGKTLMEVLTEPGEKFERPDEE